jgi:succinate-semialdehyde dehydrogenase/glutarate-semialdehyde dehydrogenase
MHKAAALLRERAAFIAKLLTLEQGKTLPEAGGEIAMAADIIEWFADEGCRVYGRIVPSRQMQVVQRVEREPVGPVAAFTPWNFPVNQVVRKLSAALATGCSIIVKAAEETPASPAELMRCFVDAGVPADVIGLVYGDPGAISSHLIAAPAIRKISFTGSTAVGKQLASLAGLHMKRATMELGGHAPVIVGADADPELAARTIAAAKFRNAGQICASPTRMLVHEAVHQRFVEALAAAAGSHQPGDGLDSASTMGPLANPRRLAAMQNLTADALVRGARLAAGGARLGEAGNFFAPTVLVDAPLEAAVWQEEPFGPMAITRPVKSLEEAIAEANRLPFGLAAYAFTYDARDIQLLSRRLQCGLLWINHAAPAWPEMPFGGVKDSGYGSEGGPEALEPYLVTKSVSVLLAR